MDSRVDDAATLGCLVSRGEQVEVVDVARCSVCAGDRVVDPARGRRAGYLGGVFRFQRIAAGVAELQAAQGRRGLHGPQPLRERLPLGKGLVDVCRQVSTRDSRAQCPVPRRQFAIGCGECAGGPQEAGEVVLEEDLAASR